MSVKGGAQSEKQFQAAVIEYARLRGWRVAHFHDSRRQLGGELVGDADAAGFPDLVCVRATRVVFVELKTERGRLRPAQKEWQEALLRVAFAGRVSVWVWRPSDWCVIEEVLR